jgi:glycosyltransferase involved in cell wall biosynthesis
MKIAYDSQIFAVQKYGGISRYFARLVENLSVMQQQVRVFAPIHCNRHLAEVSDDLVQGRFISRYPPKTARLICAWDRFSSQGAIARWQPEILHETYYARKSVVSNSCPVVVTVLDMIHDLFPANFASDDPTVSIKRAAVDRADHVICISHNTKMDLMRLYGTAAGKISVVHLGFDDFSQPGRTMEFDTPSGRPFILYVGSRGGYKNFPGLLNAVAASARLSAEFDIVAFGGGRFTADEMKSISALGFAENQVLYRGGSDDLLGNLYSSASAFVYPSLYEGFGIPPLEAMAHRCPVVCSNTGPMPEVVADAAELFDPDDRMAFCDALENVILSPDRSLELVDAGTQRITQFSWAKCSQQTLDVYRKLI